MSFKNFLGTALPIIQAPMAGVQGSALAIAVSQAGGLGSLPCAMLTLADLRKELVALREHAPGPWNVNFFCHPVPVPDPTREAQWRALLTPYYQAFGIDPDSISAGAGRTPFNTETEDLLEEFRPAVVSFHFGLPTPELLGRVKAWGATVLASATSVAEARWLQAHGADAIIAQGLEAGGHRGMFLEDDIGTQMGTFALLPQIAHAVQVPVIAAGGIADAQGVAAALSLGASAVQVGTAYLLCPEATTSQVHRAALQRAEAQTTALTRLFTGRPARGIVNRVMRELGAMNPIAPEFPLATAAMAPLRAHTERQNSGDFSPLWCGQNTSGCRPVGAAEITRALAAQLPGLEHTR